MNKTVITLISAGGILAIVMGISCLIDVYFDRAMDFILKIFRSDL